MAGGVSLLRLLAALALPLVIITTALAQEAMIPEDRLLEQLTVAEAEARYTPPPDDDAERYPDLKRPFGLLNAKWETLKRQMQPGDELWTWVAVDRVFENYPKAGAGGIALVRNGEVVASIMTWIN